MKTFLKHFKEIKYYFKHGLLLTLFFLPAFVFSQQEIKVEQIMPSQVPANLQAWAVPNGGVYTLNLFNQTDMHLEAQLKVLIKQNGMILIEATSDIFLLEPGAPKQYTYFDGKSWPSYHVSPNPGSLQTGVLPSGQLQVCTQVINPLTNQLFAEIKSTVTVQAAVNQNDCDKLKKLVLQLMQQAKQQNKNCNDLQAKIERTMNQIDIKQDEIGLTQAIIAAKKQALSIAKSNAKSEKFELERAFGSKIYPGKNSTPPGSQFIGVKGAVVAVNDASSLVEAFKKYGQNNGGKSAGKALRDYSILLGKINQLNNQINNLINRKLPNLKADLARLEAQLQQLLRDFENCKNQQQQLAQLTQKMEELEKKCNIKLQKLAEADREIGKLSGLIKQLKGLLNQAKKQEKKTQDAIDSHKDTGTERQQFAAAKGNLQTASQKLSTAESSMAKARSDRKKGKAETAIQQSKNGQTNAQTGINSYKTFSNASKSILKSASLKPSTCHESNKPKPLPSVTCYKIVSFEGVDVAPPGFTPNKYKAQIKAGHGLLNTLNTIKEIANVANGAANIIKQWAFNANPTVQLNLSDGISSNAILDAGIKLMVERIMVLFVYVKIQKITVSYKVECQNDKWIQVAQVVYGQSQDYTFKMDNEQKNQYLTGSKEKRAKKATKMLNKMKNSTRKRCFTSKADLVNYVTNGIYFKN